jgi:hypothetical protein
MWTQTNARSKTGFTLIELLTVIAIEVNSIVGAVKAYYTEYGKWPVVAGSQGAADTSKIFSSNNNELFDVLRSYTGVGSVNAGGVLNPRKIVFIEAKTTLNTSDPGVGSDGVYRDPWGKPYVIGMDLNYDNVTNLGAPYGDQFGAGVAVFSKGPDGQTWSGTGKNDDVMSFR